MGAGIGNRRYGWGMRAGTQSGLRGLGARRAMGPMMMYRGNGDMDGGRGLRRSRSVDGVGLAVRG